MLRYILIAILLLTINLSFAAVGCDLNDPDRDVKRLFPSSTGYKTYYHSVQRLGGESILQEIEERLGDKFSGVYETIDVPYTLYEIYRDEEVIGYVHGVNQRGRYGGLQVFLALDTELTITSFYMQRLSSRYRREYSSNDFAQQFAGLNLDDFKDLNILTGEGTGKGSEIKTPAPENDPDFLAIMRGVKKNLILMEYFIR